MKATLTALDSPAQTPSPRELQAAPDLLVADPDGKLFEVPELAMAGRSGRWSGLPSAEDLIEVPEGSDLFAVPDRDPVGYDRATGRLVRITEYRGIPVRPAAVFMAPAHTATWWSAFSKRKEATILPLFAYTAIGWKRDRFVAAGLRVDRDTRQDLAGFPDDEEMSRRGRGILRERGGNTLVQHVVSNCALTYRCPAARNFVLGRWEAPMPISPGCNAACVGCISEPPEEQMIPPTQPRLTVQPTAAEIADLAVGHLESADRAVVSFGQGCEGEPLLRADVMEEAIRLIRSRTPRGVINLNTNASLPRALGRLADAGLDAVRVSMNSARKETYERYYQPRSYRFEDVVESMAVLRRAEIWISINYFVFPGLTDDPAEIEALFAVAGRVRPNIIQMRNLNMDPDLYVDVVGLEAGRDRPMGIRAWMEKVRTSLPWIRFGYFNPPKEEWGPAWKTGGTGA